MKLQTTKQEPYGYRPAYLKTMDSEHDPDHVNTPALHTGFVGIDGPPPEDRRLNQLVEKFRVGKIACREAMVAMFWIRPHTDYQPPITDKFRNYVEHMDRFGHNYYKGPIPIVLYEHKGQLVMAGDYKTYWLHRMDESWSVHALILGDFTERDFCRALSDPFTVESLDLAVKDELMDSNTRRLALLMRGEPLRIETKEQMEAINMKDFRDALKEPVPYEPEWSKDMNKDGQDPSLVLTPALRTGHFFGPPPEDTRYTELVTQAQAGEQECQLASVALAMVRPYSDYRPSISGELRDEFEARYETPDELPITLYEYEPGHFMVSGADDNYATYMLYREKQLLDARCIIVGPYTKTWAVGAIDKPFQIKLSPQAGYDPKQTAKSIGKKIYDIMCDRGLYIQELARLSEIAYDELREILHEDGASTLSVEQLERITRVLGVQASDIISF